MIKNDLKLIGRKLWKNKFTTLINILGLAIGLASFILIILYVDKEFKTDQFQKNFNQIYRIENKFGEHNSYQSNILFKENIPEFRKLAFFHHDWSDVSNFEVDGRQFVTGKILISNSDFKDIFQFDVLVGNISDCLANPNSIVLTESKSKEIFGNPNSVGQAINYHSDSWGSILLTVTAVIKDYPQNSSLEFDGLISESTLDVVKWRKEGKDHWGNIHYLSFVKLDNSESVGILTAKMNELMQSHAPEWVVKEDLPYKLKPLSSLYFDTSYANDLLKHTSKTKLIFILVIGFLILTIACINYINLATAQASSKQKDINIQKTIGATKSRIFLQTILESVSLVFISFLLSVLFIFVVLPIFNNLTGTSFFPTDIFNIQHFLNFFFLVLLVGTLTGFFPAYFLTLTPFSLMQTKRSVANLNSSKLRGSLTIIQFVFTIVLIISTLVISKQVRLLINTQEGFNKEKVIYTFLPSNFNEKNESLRKDLLRIPEIANVGLSSLIPGKINDGESGCDLEHDGESKRIKYHSLTVSDNFIELFGLKLIEGKSFNNALSSLERPVIINETAVREFGLNNPLNARIAFNSKINVGNIIGVVKDFNYRSLYYKMGPIVLVLQPNECNVLNIKLNTSDLSQTRIAINKIKKVWNNYSIDIPFELHFLDYELQNLYSNETKFLKTFNLFAAISIFISCIGLLGLSLFIVEKRIKEIGIRKVNGARISEILALLNKDFVKWVAIAFVIATPIAYYAMNKWLENFAYKTELSWWIFALAGLLALGIALLTVSWQSWKAAIRNPVEALRYE